jgi:hypothetical protein
MAIDGNLLTRPIGRAMLALIVVLRYAPGEAPDVPPAVGARL